MVRRLSREDRLRLRSRIGIPAMLGSNKRFMADTPHYDAFGTKWRAEQAIEAARRAGVNPTGKKFITQLCRKGMPNDPEAWVDSLDDVRRVCEKRGWGCDGAVKVSQPSISVEDPEPCIADDIVESMIEDKEVETKQPITGKERKDLKESLKKKHTPRK